MSVNTALAPAQPSRASIGELLRSWRRRRSLSQLELALEADVSSRHVSFLERGRAPPEPRDGPAPGRAPRHSAPRAQPPPARGGLRPAVRGALARGAGDGA